MTIFLNCSSLLTVFFYFVVDCVFVLFSFDDQR